MMCSSTSGSFVSPSFCGVNFSFGFVLLALFLCWFMWPFIVTSDFSRYCLTWCAIRLDHVVKLPASVDLIKLDLTGEPDDTCNYCVASYTFETSYTSLLISSCLFLYSCVIILIRVLSNMSWKLAHVLFIWARGVHRSHSLCMMPVRKTWLNAMASP
jgi:hypothetical protein